MNIERFVDRTKKFDSDSLEFVKEFFGHVFNKKFQFGKPNVDFDGNDIVVSGELRNYVRKCKNNSSDLSWKYRIVIDCNEKNASLEVVTFKNNEVLKDDNGTSIAFFITKADPEIVEDKFNALFNRID